MYPLLLISPQLMNPMKQANSIIHISFMPSMFCKLLLNLTRLPLRNSRQAVHNSTIKKFTIKSGLHQKQPTSCSAKGLNGRAFLL